METFIVFGRYSPGGAKEISAARTKKAFDIFSKLGGKVHSIYALMGEVDLVLVVELPGIEEAMKASIALARATGIKFTTSPAVSADTLDAITAKL